MAEEENEVTVTLVSETSPNYSWQIERKFLGDEYWSGFETASSAEEAIEMHDAAVERHVGSDVKLRIVREGRAVQRIKSE